MIVLGIGDSHEAHACILKDGKLIAAIAEERLARLKADVGYPKRAIEKVLSLAGLSPEDIDVVAFGGKNNNLFQFIYKMDATFSVNDWVRQCHEYWKPRLLEGKNLNALDDFNLFREKANATKDQDLYYRFVQMAEKSDPSQWLEIANTVRTDAVVEHLGISRSKVKFYRHEDCHKIYGIYSNPRPTENGLVFTVEGFGDDSTATISRFSEKNKIEEVWKSPEVQIGRVYRYATLILGMKPNQHEYKVMGLAPYGTEYGGRKTLETLSAIHEIDGFKISQTNRFKDLYFSIRDALEGERFDGIAWGLQTWVETLLKEWIENAIDALGADDIVLSGGVAQNIKACMALTGSNKVRSLWAGPVSGDGSLGIGAAWLAAIEHGEQEPISGLDTIYLGGSWEDKSVRKAIASENLEATFEIVERPSASQASKWLADGNVIGRFCGGMEFGQRALGNRSIIADPRKGETIERINRKIKNRDFWMPFTPSMTIEEASRSLDNAKGTYSPYMTMAFNLTGDYADKIPAAIHPADKTARPQMLKRHRNPEYYDLIDEFGKLTGVSSVLNTSFNLHGEAIVESPKDAIDTFLNSDIDILLFEDVAVRRNT